MATILDGKALSARCKEEIRKEAEALAEKGCRPGMAVVLVGENSASKVYVRNKEKDCQECGIYSAMYHLPEETSEKELLELLDTLNHDSSIHGILVQLPLPKQIDAQKVIETIDPAKDVDAFHPTNVGYLTQGMPRFAPCTPAGIVRLMDAYHIDPAGKHCVVIGQAHGAAAAPEKRHGDHLPFRHKGSQGADPSGGYSGFRCGQDRLCHLGYGQGGGGGH